MGRYNFGVGASSALASVFSCALCYCNTAMRKLFPSIARTPTGSGEAALQPEHTAEIEHWAGIESEARSGARLFWLNHPRVAKHYHEKALVGGLPWREWIPQALGRRAGRVLELGCGSGDGLLETWRAGIAEEYIGLDLDESRFETVRDAIRAAGGRIRFLAADANEMRLQKSRYDLIYAVQSLHHFEKLERIMSEVRRALTPNGIFVLDEYVGPARFQWTNLQISLTNQMLGLMPVSLRQYRNGIEKACEERSTVEQVIAVCPSEAIRSDEIVRVFYDHFRVVEHKNLGGTIQHLLYSGIIHNFPDDDPRTDHLIDCIDGIESTLIERQVIPSDFVLLVGTH